MKKPIATFWSDPHLGLNRTSHTTPQSRVKLQQALYGQAIRIVRSNIKESDPIWESLNGPPVVCLGDLFDQATNDELTIAQGASIAEYCKAVLAGNHDHTNRDSAMPSLRLVADVRAAENIYISEDNDSYDYVSLPPYAAMVLVPHKLTQELFGQTLQRVYEERLRNRQAYEEKEDTPPLTVLCLHCNYNSGFATDDATLNLPREDAALLLEVFDYVLIGHEHIARDDFDGRLQVLGNIHPTSFSDISDKFVWDLYEDGTLEPRRVWSADNAMKVSWQVLLDTPAMREGNWEGLQFIDITGTAPASRLPDIAKAVSELWRISPDALMIRNSVVSEELEITQVEAHRALDIPTKIAEELKGTDMQPLWENLVARIAE